MFRAVAVVAVLALVVVTQRVLADEVPKVGGSIVPSVSIDSSSMPLFAPAAIVSSGTRPVERRMSLGETSETPVALDETSRGDVVERPVPQRAPYRVSNSVSVGLPTRGRLTNGARLEATGYVQLLPAYVRRRAHYGTAELVGAIERAAAYVERIAPGARLPVGELSRERGGDIAGHRSHESGRDADLGFYLLDEAGAPIEANDFVQITAAGIGYYEGRLVRFDDHRNFRLVEALVTDLEAQVHLIVVSRVIERRLLREAKRRGASRDLIDRLNKVLIVPEGRHPHRNHFHVRIYCPVADRPSCYHRGDVWPWLAGRFDDPVRAR